MQAFGFLTVLEDSVHGVFGGYLVLSHHGRPLEFRCSTPVKASRAQEILYGPALRPYLWGEVVGKQLVSTAEVRAGVVLTDRAEMLALGLCIPEEVLYVAPAGPEVDVAEADAPIRLGEKIESTGRSIYLAPTSLSNVAAQAASLAPLLAEVDPLEPFQRIRAALCEVGNLSSDAPEDQHIHAAAA
ncbi:MAG: hypothetical protein KDA61_02995 [Planctomycetales bacterium]|nr:hypothetical protein [Planctomycetales bacterium]